MKKTKAVVKSEEGIVLLKGNLGVTTSLIVAEKFEVWHKNVIQKIEKLLEKDKVNRLNFQPVEYQDKKGEFRKMYEMNKRNFNFSLS